MREAALAHQVGYNERLFSGSGLRSFYHFARYRWLRSVLDRNAVGPLRVIELGCFDGKALDYMPDPVDRYVGLDANWEGGLDIGREKLRDRTDVRLVETQDPAMLDEFAAGAFNVGLAMETLEHIPQPARGAYLAQLARIVDGFILISVPNEMGPVFLAKHLAKRLRYGADEPYTLREIVAATRRRMDEVPRSQTGHKGFSYTVLIDELRTYFDIVSVEGMPSLGLPAALSLSVGIVARTRRTN